MIQKSPIQNDKIDGDRSAKTLLVWDLPVRIFHWSMVLVVGIAAITGFLAPTWWLDIHVIAGYALTTLLVFRLIWGFTGSRYSQFKSFPLAISGAFQHLRELMRFTSHPVIGHNPVGAWVIVMLLTALIGLVISGVVTLGGQEKLGPLAFVTSFDFGVTALSLHEIAAWILVALVSTHFLGVITEQRLFKHPVIAAMFSGKITTHLQAATEPASDNASATHTRRGVALYATSALLLVASGWWFSQKPVAGWVPLNAPDSYTSECSDCHDAYHPSLRTHATWNNILDNLSDHFGEDASLDDETTAEINAYLTAHDAATFDTEVSHRVGRVDTDTGRMTDVPFWKKRHEDIADDVFSQSDIGSKINCNACHKDAPIGRFDDSNIHIPLENQ